MTFSLAQKPVNSIVQKNRNFLKKYWILRNILLPFNRIRIWFSNILIPLKGTRIRVVKILLQQNFNRIYFLGNSSTFWTFLDIFWLIFSTLVTFGSILAIFWQLLALSFGSINQVFSRLRVNWRSECLFNSEVKNCLTKFRSPEKFLILFKFW